MEEINIKEEIDFLRRRVVVLDKRYRTSAKRLETLQPKYDDLSMKFNALSNSKLGRLELNIWKIKKYIKRKLSNKLPGLVALLSKNKCQEDIINTNNEVYIRKRKSKLSEIKKSTQSKSTQPKSTQPQIPICMNETVILNDKYVFDWKEQFLELRNSICDLGYYNRIKELVDQLPVSNGSKYFGKMPYTIGIIADQFLHSSYVDAADFIYITPDDYKYDIDFLFVATSWKGVNGEWKGLGNINNTTVRDKLFNIIEYYRSIGKKIIFYSKEDPSNYYVFLDIAKECDYIFTTAEECIELYKADTNIENVNVLDFAINPIYFNPIGSQKYNLDEVIFAGTWWNKKYPERKEDMEVVFQSVLKAGKKLKLIDRNYSLGNADFFYPINYLPYISPEIPHDVLQKLHRLYSWAININSIKNSITMFAGRVYELQALGNLIISNHSIGMEEKFPDIIIEDGTGKATEALLKYSGEELYLKKTQGIRRVMTGETVYDRLTYILNCIGIPYDDVSRKIGIIIEDDSLLKMAEDQTYKNKQIILKKELTEIVYQSLDMITFFDIGNEYDMYYVEDMINGFKYTNSDFITKLSYYLENELIEGSEHEYTNLYSFERTVFWVDCFSFNEISSRNRTNEHIGYSIDHFNYKQKKLLVTDL